MCSTGELPAGRAARQAARHEAQACKLNVHNGALVAIDSSTGEIVAYVGSVDYYNREDKRVQGQFDVAGARSAPAGIGLQADHLQLRVPGARGDPGDLLRRLRDPVRIEPDQGLHPDQRRHQGPRPAAGDGRACTTRSTCRRCRCSTWSGSADRRIRGDDGDRQRRLHQRPGSGAHPDPRLGPGQPHEHDRRVRRLRRPGHAAPGNHDPRDPRSERPHHLQHRRRRPAGHPPHDPGGVISHPLDHPGQHGPAHQS